MSSGAGDSACWRRIGVHGDGSCPELAVHVHCRNCPVHAQAGRRLLDRPPPAEYQAELAEGMAARPAPPPRGSRPVLVFRVAGQWLAIDTPLIREVVSMRPAHSLPNHPETALLGLVNVRGTLEICVSLQALMDLPAPPGEQAGGPLLVLQREGDTFACPVDEIAGITVLAPGDLGEVPVTLQRAERRHVEGVLQSERGPAGLLEAGRLFSELAGRVFR